MNLTRHDMDSTLALQRGATHQNGAYRFVVDAIDRTSASVSILARESHATSVFDRRPTPMYSFYLRNQRAGEAVQGAAHDLLEQSLWSRFLPLGFSVSPAPGFRTRNLLIRFPPSVGVQGESFSIDDEWLETAELVIVRATRAGSVGRTLKIADFPLRAKTPITVSSTSRSQR